MSKKANIFGKKVPVFVIAMIAVMGIVSAALLGYYGIITGNAIVSQSVILTGSPTFSFNALTSFVAGESFTDCDYSVKNNADVEAPVQFGTTCRNTAGTDDGVQTKSYIDWADGIDGPECDGIVTEIYGILELSTKDTSTWAVDGNKATVKYTIVGDVFNAEVIDGVEPEYELIYYKDAENAQTVAERKANPQKAIKIANVLGNLPYVNDGNVQEGANYCAAPDNYEHCKGAKIWYVPTSALSGCDSNGVCDINWGQWDSFLYETDLIVYSSDTANKITLPANGGGFNFCVENDFALNLVPETYTLTTKILPA